MQVGNTTHIPSPPPRDDYAEYFHDAEEGPIASIGDGDGDLDVSYDDSYGYYHPHPIHPSHTAHRRVGSTSLSRPMPLRRHDRVHSAPLAHSSRAQAQSTHKSNNHTTSTTTSAAAMHWKSHARSTNVHKSFETTSPAHTPLHTNGHPNHHHHYHHPLQSKSLDEAAYIDMPIHAHNMKSHRVFDSIQETEHYEEQLEFIPSGNESHDNDESIVSGLTADEASYTQSVRSAPPTSTSLPEGHHLHNYRGRLLHHPLTNNNQHHHSHGSGMNHVDQPLNEYFDELGPGPGPGLEDHFWVNGQGQSQSQLPQPPTHVPSASSSSHHQHYHYRSRSNINLSGASPMKPVKGHRYTASHDTHATHAQLHQRLGNTVPVPVPGPGPDTGMPKPALLKARSSSNTIHSNAPSTASTSYSSAQAWSGQSGSGMGSSDLPILPPHGGRQATNHSKRPSRPKNARRHHSMGSYASQHLTAELFPPKPFLPNMQGLTLGGQGVESASDYTSDELVKGRERHQPGHRKVQTSIYDGDIQLSLSTSLGGDSADDQSASVISRVTPNGDASSRATPTGDSQGSSTTTKERKRKTGVVKQELKYVMGKMIPSPIKNISKLAIRRKQKTELERSNGTLT